jgi:hypothetical protein
VATPPVSATVDHLSVEHGLIEVVADVVMMPADMNRDFFWRLHSAALALAVIFVKVFTRQFVPARNN